MLFVCLGKCINGWRDWELILESIEILAKGSVNKESSPPSFKLFYN